MNYGRKVEKAVVLGSVGMARVCADVLMSGEVCRVDYMKKDGEQTTMICRHGVKKHLVGTGKTATKPDKGLVNVWSFDRQGYRTLQVTNILMIKHGGIMYDFRRLHGDETPTGVYNVVSFKGGRTPNALTSPLLRKPDVLKY